MLLIDLTMTKELQKELKEKVREGIKPSDLKKLKRSKSEGDIPKASPLPKSIPLTKSKSTQELESVSPSREELETQISVLELKLETAQREIAEKEAEKQALQEKLAQPQNYQELDQNLFARHKNLKD